jgi:hypothetical protein
MSLPYEWQIDLERNRTGANVHDSRSMAGQLMCWLYLIERHKKDKKKIKYFEKKINETLKEAFKKGLMSYKHELI